MQKPKGGVFEKHDIRCKPMHTKSLATLKHCYLKSNYIKVVAQYGQGYGKENPVSVLYHAYGHYDLLKSPLAPL
uniref:OTU domain-containing protein n=1 Tax=Tanacetum cinerariifolium TaxID=118510 RepID=A0A699IHL0_TANCI|nr:hypothetical protein [Tanacetum cinerariifolium]